MPKLTQLQFLAKCKQTANKNLDFSRAVYKSAKTKVKLSCKEHPDQVFYMTPDSIYKGHGGCPVCYRQARQKATEQQFLQRVKNTANPNLDFSGMIYFGNSIVEFSCKKHPEQRFTMTCTRVAGGYTCCRVCIKEKKIACWQRASLNSRTIRRKMQNNQ